MRASLKQCATLCDASSQMHHLSAESPSQEATPGLRGLKTVSLVEFVIEEKEDEQRATGQTKAYVWRHMYVRVGI